MSVETFFFLVLRQELSGFTRGRPPALNKRPYGTVDELMKGELTYVVGVPDTPDAALTVQVGTHLLQAGGGWG